MFAKGGYTAAVYPFSSLPELPHCEDTDAVIVDTDSRFLTPAEAAERVRVAARRLRELPCGCYFKKTCSVFRGNIGAEFDALQEVTGAGTSMVVLGFPENGRTTVFGRHYVNGIPLEQSQFRRDPVNPMTESDLVSILSKQTQKTAASIPYPVLEQGAVRARISALRGSTAYLIFDVRSRADLRVIAEAIKDEPCLCGSSAIAEELPSVWAGSPVGAVLPGMPRFPGGTMIAAGSLTPQTRAQTEYLRAKGIPSVRLDPRMLLKENVRAELAKRSAGYLASAVTSFGSALLYTANDAENVAETKARFRAAGFSDAETGKWISAALAEIVASVRKQTNFRRLVVAGGDTSEAVCAKLGVQRMLILREIEPGIPSVLGSGNCGELLMVLKSGSFGSESFLEKAALALGT